jgi:hypothetical protein
MPNRFRRTREARRVVEMDPTDSLLISSGAAGSGGVVDPIDGDRYYQPAGTSVGTRPVPTWTLEKSRAQSVAAYRANPMGRAIIDTYTSFCVGDTGVRPQSNVAEVQAVLDEFWTHPLVNLAENQELWLRSHLLNGESIVEALVGDLFGAVRLKPIDPTAIQSVRLRDGNPLWPREVTLLSTMGETVAVPIVAYSDLSGLREGTVFYRADWQSVVSDVRGLPFLTPALDWLAAYDRTLWNLIDRTAIARYLVWDVTVQGGDDDVRRFIDQRGIDPPESGSIEVHNDGVSWEPKSAPSMAEEDSTTAQQVLTSVAGGVGLAKPWLSDPEGSNRASAVTMAEPVRRRIEGVQRQWLAFMREISRFVVDQAVRTGGCPRFVTIPDDADGGTREVAAWRTVEVIGPEIAATDASINATILSNVGAALVQLVPNGMLAPEAARRIAQKAWEDYMGQPWRPGLDDPETTQKWLDTWGAKPEAPPAPASPGNGSPVNGQIGAKGPTQAPRPPGDNTARVGAPP